MSAAIAEVPVSAALVRHQTKTAVNDAIGAANLRLFRGFVICPPDQGIASGTTTAKATSSTLHFDFGFRKATKGIRLDSPGIMIAIIL